MMKIRAKKGERIKKMRKKMRYSKTNQTLMMKRMMKKTITFFEN